MLHTLKATALSTLVCLSALAAAPASAQAQEDGIYLKFGVHRGGAQLEVNPETDEVHYRDRRHRGEERRHWRRDWREDWPGWYDWRDDRRAHGWRRACSPHRALNKAERMGLRRVRVVDVSRRTITVAGRSYRGRQIVTFARAPRCPVLR